MTGTSDLNIVVSGGSAIKEIYDVRKQSLELNQQYVAQNDEVRRKDDKGKTQEISADNRIEIGKEKEDKKEDERKREKSDPEKKGSDKKEAEDKTASDSERLIDIMV